MWKAGAGMVGSWVGSGGYIFVEIHNPTKRAGKPGQVEWYDRTHGDVVSPLLSSDGDSSPTSV
jgi:hypothetical protein